MQELTTFISNHSLLVIAGALVIILLVIVEYLRAKGNTINILPTNAVKMINHDQAVVIDIRPNEAFRQGHIIDAYSLTAREMQENPKKIEKFRIRPIIIVCNTGVESQKIASLLFKQGYNAYALSGGMRGWSDAQMPIVKG